MIFHPTGQIEYNDAKPALKWAGGKGQLLGQIIEQLPSKLKNSGVERYVEPFVGGGAVFFEINNRYDIKEAYLFDINPELVILYNVIKNNVDLLAVELKNIQSEYQTSEAQKEYFYEARSVYNSFNKQLDANCYDLSFVKRAALTIFLNRTCFNGLFRVNSKNKFNVPVGNYKNPRILDENNLISVSKALQKAVILQADFSVALEYANDDSFIYYDPPYRPIKKTSSFNSYSIGDFNDSEQKRLKSVFDAAHNSGVLQMLSNSDPTNYIEDEFFDELYKEYHIQRVLAKRMINSKANARGAIRELLITNYNQ